ncbi:Fe 2+/Pb2+ permease [Brevibacillus reuszeri]|uniref:Fe 2+/Pb2+ permease n=1 Tax=Brevibacillus reuszeri TaxID=54915 RepID=A0A0K9YSE7_9BACL|nr:FTR1 family protein [Brevibacillus reuszeri]KNB71562.1 iron permease [Brevibacillus reuszeri]MED1855625.1 FTR1 family iron permease [Brevibacillus reuszeri]GED67225.1 Fe 2+/Pb2+ permease [Brevibacillus reuszeri]
MKRYLFIICMCFLLVTSGLQAALAATLQPDQLKQLIALSSDALISSGDQNWDEAKKAVADMKTLWDQNADETSVEATALGTAISDAQHALSEVAANPQAATAAISKLAKATDRFVTAKEDTGQPKEKAHKQIAALLPHLQKSMTAITKQNWDEAKQAYNSFVTGWYKAESLVRNENTSVYGDMEIKISGARIALNTEPPDPQKSTEKMQALIIAVEDYLSGKAVQNAETAPVIGDQPSIASLMQLLESVESDIAKQDADSAASKMDTFISTWPSVEGVVMTKSPETYSSVEAKMVSIPTLILSNPPKWEKAAGLLADMKMELEPYTTASSYTAWDAGLILFREGLEAILIIISLLTFLNKSGNAHKRKWIWSGAAAGMVASAILAVILSIVFSNLSTGSSRETIEGVTGLIAVLFMITIGAWLHRKSNLQAWNRFVEQSIGASLAKGALWSLAFTAFLAVVREGAETIIFYMGMAATISMTDLLVGIIGALVVLAVIGYAIIRLSTRIPVRPFFLVAGLLLYYMAFKFVGVSVHALQVTGHLSAHSSDFLFHIPTLGIYANWETTVPQVIVLAIVIFNIILNTRKKTVKPIPQIN